MENFSFPFFGPKTTRLPLSPRKPVKTLTLEERVNVIMMGSRGVSARKIAQQLGVGKTQIQNILHRKELILEDYRNNVPYNRKRRIRKTANEEINEVCWKWFQNTTGLGINVTGPMLKEKAMHLAREFDRPNFKASNGWLESFTKRNKIAFGRATDETR